MADHDKALRLLGDLVAELQKMDFPDPHHTDKPMTADRLFMQYTVAVRKTIEDHQAYDAYRARLLETP